MARIRIGDFGGRVAPASPSGRIPPGATVQQDAGLADGVQRLSTQLLKQDQLDERQAAHSQAQSQIAQARQAMQLAIAEEKQAEREAAAEQRRKDAELRRAKGVEAYATFQADLDETAAELGTALAEKRIKRDDLQGEFEKRLTDLKAKRLEGLDDEQKASVGAHFITAERSARARLRSAVALDQKQERVASVQGALEGYQRLALSDPAGAIRQAHMLLDAEGPGIMGADKVGAEKQKFAENAWASHFTSRLVAARNDGGALAKLEQQIASNETLDPDRKSLLTGRIAGMRETIAARAARAEESRLRTLQAQIDASDRLIMSGYQPSVQQFDALTRAAKGTPYEAVVRQQAQFSAFIGGFMTAPPLQREQAITETTARVRQNPTPENVQMLDRMRALHKNLDEAVKDDPISFAGRQGLATVQPINWQEVGTLKDQLAARADIARGMAGQYGAPVKVLTKEEAKQLTEIMRTGRTEDRVQMLGALKAAIPDPQAYQATMQQIAPDSPVTAWAGAIMGRRPQVQRNVFTPNVETQATRAAELLLKGEGLLNPTRAEQKGDGRRQPFPMPPDKDLREAFAGEMGAAFGGRADAYQVGLQATKAMYAALSAEEDKDYSGQLDSTRLKRAIRLATGGVADVGGVKTVLPWGMDESTFRDAAYKRLTDLREAGAIGFPQQQLSRMGFEAAGDGQYLVRSGTGYLLDKKGTPVRLNLLDQAMQPTGFVDAQGRRIVDQVPR